MQTRIQMPFVDNAYGYHPPRDENVISQSMVSRRWIGRRSGCLQVGWQVDVDVEKRRTVVDDPVAGEPASVTYSRAALPLAHDDSMTLCPVVPKFTRVKPMQMSIFCSFAEQEYSEMVDLTPAWSHVCY